jgi:predicted deacetylase
MTSIAATQFLPVVATTSAAKNSLIVSVHDVAPSTQPIADKIISELAHRGARTCSLLVIPDYHHQGASMKNRQFVSWLRGLEAQGYEIVIHGYFHERQRRRSESLGDRFVTRVYTQGEGEFYDLRYEEAFRRIQSARDDFRAAGLHPRGFIAPAWLLSAEAQQAACDAEMEYTTRLRTIRDLRSGENFRARSLVYSVRNRWRRASSLVWNEALARLLKSKSLLRLSVHPQDYEYPAIWRQIVDLLRRMDDSRTATTYQDWIAERRLDGSV